MKLKKLLKRLQKKRFADVTRILTVPERGECQVEEFLRLGIAAVVVNAQYTDSNGIAEFDADYGQEGMVYVDGSEEGHWGSYSAREVTVYL